MLRRIIGALLLKDEIYEEIEADRGATIQAVLVVVLSQLATSIWYLVMFGWEITVLVALMHMSEMEQFSAA